MTPFGGGHPHGNPGSISLPSESSLSHRICLVWFKFSVWFADYYTVRAHPKIVIVAMTGYSKISKKIRHFL